MNRERYMQLCVCGLCDKCKGKQQCPAYRTALNAWDAAVKATKEKTCEWLKENADKYYHSSSQSDDCYFDLEQMLEDFCKAIEE